MQHSEREKLYFPIYFLCVFLLALCLYWFGYDALKAMKMTSPVVDVVIVQLAKAHLFTNSYILRLAVLVLVVAINIIKCGKSTDTPWSSIIILEAFGLVFFLFPCFWPGPFLFLTIFGFIILNIGTALLGRKLSGAQFEDNDVYETFLQCDELIENPDSINLKTTYQYKKKIHHGYVNIVNPYGGCVVMGAPGSGKSYSFFYPFIETMIAKHYSCFLYDFKQPDLTTIVYNKYLQTYPFAKEKVKAFCEGPLAFERFEIEHENDEVKTPLFCFINFDDPIQTMRCNPLNVRYIPELTDAHELADILMKNANPLSIKNEDPFFGPSAKIFIATCVWILARHKGGIYCSLPHLIELLGKNYMAILEICGTDKSLSVMIQPFVDAVNDGAQEQLQGQIASARIPLLKFPANAFYWVLTGDDFSLDINNPENPKIVCVGNNPDRQEIYSTALSLYTSRMIKKINHKYCTDSEEENLLNLPCAVLLDEFPTIYMNGIAPLLATARGNRVAICLGIQDITQLKERYGQDQAASIISTIGNIFSGRVNTETAKMLSESMGREFRRQQSETTGGDSDTINTSYQLQEILPQSRIETLTNGYFLGKVIDTNKNPIERKFFCAKIIVDTDARAEEERNFEQLPNFGQRYFNFASLESDIESRKDDYIKENIMLELQKEELRKQVAMPDYVPMKVEEMHALMNSVFRSLDDDQKAARLKRATKAAKKRLVDDVLEKNADKIRADIVQIFADYNIDIDHYEPKKPKGKDSSSKFNESSGGSGKADSQPA